MVTELLFDFLFDILFSLLEKLPDYNIEIPETAITSALDWIRLAGYLLPMDAILNCFQIILYLALFRIVISLVKTIWEIIPIL